MLFNCSYVVFEDFILFFSNHEIHHFILVERYEENHARVPFCWGGAL